MKTLTKFVIFCIATIIIYVITAIAFQALTHEQLPDSITMGMFTFFGTELCVSAAIKVFKIHGNNANNEQEEMEDNGDEH